MGEGHYEERHRDGFKCHDKNFKFHKHWFWHFEVDGGGEIETLTAKCFHNHILFFFQNKENGLKVGMSMIYLKKRSSVKNLNKYRIFIRD
jgi:hypothetical protein